MIRSEFRFVYHPENGSSRLEAYDASQALYGISRSISILTHYAINRKVIKQAPALAGARVLIEPPKVGSFEIIVPVFQTLSDPANVMAITQGLATNFLYDLTKLVYRRLAGKSDAPTSKEMFQLSREKPGDIDALTDSISEDVVRIHRPLTSEYQRINKIVVNAGGTVNIINFDHGTLDYVKSKSPSRIASSTSQPALGYAARGWLGSISRSRQVFAN